MAYINSYKPPPEPSPTEAELYGPEPYDLNFVYPLHFPSLETDRLKLTPFIPRVYVKHYWPEVQKHPDLFRYYSFAWPTANDFLEFLEFTVRRNQNNVIFAIIDKTKPDQFADQPPEFGGGSLAGMLGLFHSSAPNLMSEIAYIAILPPFQRTHVTTNAVGLLMRYCLELPSSPTPGLGLRRVEWRAHSRNISSATTAARMGFRREGIMRWHVLVPPALARDGDKPREGDKWPDRYGRHTLFLSVCWDDWENGVKDLVQKNMDRAS